MSLEIVPATNVHRTILLEPVADNMATAILKSKVVDFREMIIGSIQVKWDGNDAADGEIALEASNIPEEDWFDEIDSAVVTLSQSGSGRTNKKVKLFNHGLLGFRYARVVYYKGNNTQGTIQVMALGKKGG